jgi:hypothetical protein
MAPCRGLSPVAGGKLRALANIDDLSRRIARELAGEFERKLRAELADRDRQWLIDQLVRLVLEGHRLTNTDDEVAADRKRAARTARAERARALAVDGRFVRSFAAEHGKTSREHLLATGALLPAAPAKGTELIEPAHRSAAGESLLEQAKDILFALLFGDASTDSRLERVQQELLTMALPRHKAQALDFMRASTELAAAGTWQDPDSVSNDERADNVLIEVQFGETADEIVGNGIVAALALINNLEINEQVLYARMIDVEETTLIP